MPLQPAAPIEHLFRRGKPKALVMSYDDGNVQIGEQIDYVSSLFASQSDCDAEQCGCAHADHDLTGKVGRCEGSGACLGGTREATARP